jgi:hypothetical protein
MRSSILYLIDRLNNFHLSAWPSEAQGHRAVHCKSGQHTFHLSSGFPFPSLAEVHLQINKVALFKSALKLDAF